jgi:NitT/TauT family transport system substrate-binding protein
MIPLTRLGLAALALIGLNSIAHGQTKVRVGNVNTVSDIGIYIADRKGYFKAEGLDVDFVGFKTAAQMIAPLGAGQLDVGGGTVSAGLYNAVGRKIGIRIVADKGSSRAGYNFSRVMVRKDLIDNGRYKTFADLKGMRVAIAAVGTGNAATLNEALKKAGLAFSDVTTIDLGFPDHLIAYRNKAIDAGVTNEPTATLAERAGVAVSVPGNDTLFANHQTAVLLYSDDFALKRRPTALKFMRAYLRGVRDYNDALKDGKIAGPGAEEIIQTLVAYTDIKEPTLHRDMSPAACNPDGAADVASLAGDLEFFKQMKLIETPDIKAGDVVDNSFVDEVVKEMGTYRTK